MPDVLKFPHSLGRLSWNINLDVRAPTDDVTLQIISAARILRRLAILEFTSNNATKFDSSLDILVTLTRTRKFHHRNKLEN